MARRTRPIATTLLWACAPFALGCHPPAAAVPSKAPVAAPIERTFAVDPATGTLCAPNFAVIGDFGDAGPGEAAVAALVHSWGPDFVVSTGDNNYPHGAKSTFERNVAQYYARYIAFGPAYQGPYRAQGIATGPTRFFAALGNHDWHTEGAADHLAAWAQPGNGRYFRVEKGAVDLFFVDSDRHEPDGTSAQSTQALWLQQALHDSGARVKVVVFHHPPFTVGGHKSAEWMRWPFAAWGASMVLSGHNHDYERHTIDGIPYIVNGIGGAHLHALGAACTMAESSRDVCFSGGFGAMRIRGQADGDGHDQALLVEGMDTTNTVFDRFAVPF